MKLTTLVPAAAVCALALGGASITRADDQPGHAGGGHQMGGHQTGGHQTGGATTQPGTGEGGHDMSKMSHDEMMQDCHEHAMKAQEHLDEANKSAEANDMAATKKHLALAKDEMDKCMKMMMAAMEKKDAPQPAR